MSPEERRKWQEDHRNVTIGMALASGSVLDGLFEHLRAVTSEERVELLEQVCEKMWDTFRNGGGGPMRNEDLYYLATKLWLNFHAHNLKNPPTDFDEPDVINAEQALAKSRGEGKA